MLKDSFIIHIYINVFIFPVFGSYFPSMMSLWGLFLDDPSPPLLPRWLASPRTSEELKSIDNTAPQLYCSSSSSPAVFTDDECCHCDRGVKNKLPKPNPKPCQAQSDIYLMNNCRDVGNTYLEDTFQGNENLSWDHMEKMEELSDERLSTHIEYDYDHSTTSSLSVSPYNSDIESELFVSLDNQINDQIQKADEPISTEIDRTVNIQFVLNDRNVLNCENLATISNSKHFLRLDSESTIRTSYSRSLPDYGDVCRFCLKLKQKFEVMSNFGSAVNLAVEMSGISLEAGPKGLVEMDQVIAKGAILVKGKSHTEFLVCVAAALECLIALWLRHIDHAN